MDRTFLTIVILLTCGLSFGQKVDGYYISHDNDTVKTQFDLGGKMQWTFDPFGKYYYYDIKTGDKKLLNRDSTKEFCYKHNGKTVKQVSKKYVTRTFDTKTGDECIQTKYVFLNVRDDSGYLKWYDFPGGGATTYKIPFYALQKGDENIIVFNPLSWDYSMRNDMYFSDCPTIPYDIRLRDINTRSEIVHEYNKKCAAYAQPSGKIYTLPDFFYSKSRFNTKVNKQFSFNILTVIDKRIDFVDEPIFKKVKSKVLCDKWSLPLLKIIQNKISNDLDSLGFTISNSEQINIQPVLEVFYAKPKGLNGFEKAYTKVRIAFTVVKNDTELFRQTYETVYMTRGHDKDWEGSYTSLWTIGDIALAACFRLTLDKFYMDLNTKLN